tara:strand:- start:361 stop:543 length:183 start_codon:yes stop_codon:yes gene_type:complete
MCKPGNQTIYRDCYEAAKKHKGSNPTNGEVRELLDKHDGCLVPDRAPKLDKAREGALVFG